MRVRRSTAVGALAVAWSLLIPLLNEIGVGTVAIANAAALQITWSKTIATSALNPPSPDSSGVAYDPRSDRLVMVDSEVEEMTIYAGVNLWTMTRTASVVSTATTVPRSVEPTGLGFALGAQPADDVLYVSDDDADKIWIYKRGADGTFATADDVVSSFDTRSIPSGDPEDVAFDSATGDMFVVEGTDTEVFRINDGPNNRFDSLPSKGGDDVLVAQIDVGASPMNMVDAEGLAANPANNSLMLCDRRTKMVTEISNSIPTLQGPGVLLNTIDVTNSGIKKCSDLTLAPPTDGTGSMHLFLVDRGTIDNDSDPTENDGSMFEVAYPGAPQSNFGPTANAGPDVNVQMPDAATLSGSVADDGHPSPPGTLTAAWSTVSGPGTVTFANAGAASTTATFSAPGTYVLRLTAHDTLLSASDDTTVKVAEAVVGGTINIPVRASADDAEQAPGGGVGLSSSDLELVTDGTANQTVGLRFTGIPIPKGAVISNAYVQFTVDEVSTAATSLNVFGQQADTAAAFTTSTNNVSSRPRTAGIPWMPPAWPTVGAAAADQRTPNLFAIVQEIVHRPGWAPGNALALIITGTGKRTAEAFDGSAAPVLHVEFTNGPPPNQAPNVDAGPNQTIAQPTSSTTLTGAVSDDGLPLSPGATTVAWTEDPANPAPVVFGTANAESTTVSFTTLGTYTFHLTADDGELTATDFVTVTYTSVPVSIAVPVKTAADDAEEKSTGKVNLTSADLELVQDDTTQRVGLRFAGVGIPKGATITNAYVQFTVDEASTAAASLAVQGEASDNAAAFTTATNNVSARPRTSSVPWTPASWSAVGAAGADQRTPDLSPIVQAIVDRSGWGSGNALAFIITGTGRRTAEAFDGTAAPVLHVAFTTGPPVNEAPSVHAGPNQTVVAPASASLNGTITDDGLPSGSTTTAAWSKVSGPGDVTFADENATDTTASFTELGTYLLRLTASDGEKSGSDEVTITYTDVVTTVTLNVPVRARADDAEQGPSGAVDLSSSDLELVADGSSVQTVGLRFSGVAIPNDATITNAYVQFTVDEVSTGATNLTVRGQAADNAPAFTSTTNNVSSRTRTSALASWAVPSWPTVGASGPDQRTPDLSAIVQEIVDGAGWTSGNALAVIVMGTGRRTAEAFDGTAAPVLHIEYHV